MAAVVLLTAAVLILSFLSSSVMPNAIRFSAVWSPLSIGLDAVVLSATGAFETAFLEKLKLICMLFGDTFGESMSKSVFFVMIVGCVDVGGSGGGTLIVADVDVFVVADGGDGIVNVAVFVSVFAAADDEGAVIVYEATTVSVDALNGTDTVLDSLVALTDDATTALPSAVDLTVGTRSPVVALAVVGAVVVDVVLDAEFSV